MRSKHNLDAHGHRPDRQTKKFSGLDGVVVLSLLCKQANIKKQLAAMTQ
jgi:hypothetical protein